MKISYGDGKYIQGHILINYRSGLKQ